MTCTARDQLQNRVRANERQVRLTGRRTVQGRQALVRVVTRGKGTARVGPTASVVGSALAERSCGGCPARFRVRIIVSVAERSLSGFGASGECRGKEIAVTSSVKG